MILILSSDAVAAALFGALIETLGYSVTFAPASERPEETLRRVRPDVCLIDSAHRAASSDAFLGHAAMRGISVIIFGTAEDRVRALALEHAIETISVPPDTLLLAKLLERARRKAE